MNKDKLSKLITDGSICIDGYIVSMEELLKIETTTTKNIPDPNQLDG